MEFGARNKVILVFFCLFVLSGKSQNIRMISLDEQEEKEETLISSFEAIEKVNNIQLKLYKKYHKKIIFSPLKDDLYIYPLQVKTYHHHLIYPSELDRSMVFDSTPLSDISPSNFIPSQEKVDTFFRAWVKHQNTWNKGIIIRSTDGDSYTETHVVGANKVVAQYDRLCYHSGSDSTLHTLVFNPDPLTTANTNYGGNYSDQNDADHPALSAELKWVHIPVFPDSTPGTYQYKNQFATIKEFSLPNKPLAPLLSDSLLVDRSQEAFEAVNALYHITEIAQYLTTLGFGEGIESIDVDVNGFNGADQSAFSALPTPKRLTFGEGGVDDAEDADVIVHEYGHAIWEFQAPGLLRTGELAALSEGFSDYLAVSYSRGISPNQWEKVFTWDGHNEFWPGRIANKPGRYPTDLQNNLYFDGELWASTLMEVWEMVGKEVCDKIVVQSLSYYINGMTMVDAAQFLLQAEEDLYQGHYKDAMCSILESRGFIENCNTFAEEIRYTPNWQVIQKREVLEVTLHSKVLQTVQLYNAIGQCVAQTRGKTTLFLPTINIKPGVYFVVVTGTPYSKKVVIP